MISNSLRMAFHYMPQRVCNYYNEGEDFDANSSFAEYDLVKELGEGGFGKVVLGIHRKTGEKFAIKIIKTHMIGNA